MHTSCYGNIKQISYPIERSEKSSQKQFSGTQA